jgi:hypothetical protein
MEVKTDKISFGQLELMKLHSAVKHHFELHTALKDTRNNIEDIWIQLIMH